MFNAPCGVRSSVSERKRSVRSGLFYVQKILNNDCAHTLKKITLFLTATERLVSECGVVADHLLSSCLSVWTLTGTADKDKMLLRESVTQRCFGRGEKTLVAF